MITLDKAKENVQWSKRLWEARSKTGQYIGGGATTDYSPEVLESMKKATLAIERLNIEFAILREKRRIESTANIVKTSQEFIEEYTEKLAKVNREESEIVK